MIRRMRAQDVPEVMKIESVSFGRHHWSEDSFFNEMNNHMGRYYVLVHKGNEQQLSGYCGFWQVIDEAHVTTVAIQPQLRGNSLGELLLVHMLDRCMGSSIQWVTLEVRVTNYNAQNLYYKYGFELAGRRAKYYQDNQEDALVMTTPSLMTDSYRTIFNRNKTELKQKLGGFPDGMGQ